MQRSKSVSSDLHGTAGENGGSTSSKGGIGGPEIPVRGLMSSTRILKSRPKSQTSGETCTWTPGDTCKWRSMTGQEVTLEPTSVLMLSEAEREGLQAVAIIKLRALNLGVEVKIPNGSSGGSGLVFAIPLLQCVLNDRQKRNAVPENISCSSADLLWDKVLPAESQSSGAVPLIVTACIKHLEPYGLHTTWIFRASTSLKRVRQLREEIDAGKDVEFGEEDSPHDVAALLKEFLRDLPEPLLCRDLYQAFLQTQKIRSRRTQLEAVQHLIQLLPVPNRDTLAALLQFLAKVVENAWDRRSETGELLPGNMMEAYSLASLLAPIILPCLPREGRGTTEQRMNLNRERRESILVVNYLICSQKELFEVTAEVLDELYRHMLDTSPEHVEAGLNLRAGLESGE